MYEENNHLLTRYVPKARRCKSKRNKITVMTGNVGKDLGRKGMLNYWVLREFRCPSKTLYTPSSKLMPRKSQHRSQMKLWQTIFSNISGVVVVPDEAAQQAVTKKSFSSTSAPTQEELCELVLLDPLAKPCQAEPHVFFKLLRTQAHGA